MSQFKLVPVEPTKEMIDAASSRSLFEEDFGWAKGYAVMVAAAPEPAQEPIAWIVHFVRDGGGADALLVWETDDAEKQVAAHLITGIEPLYATPAPPTNLSDARDACPYCSDFQLGAIYFDQNCRACVNRMGKTPIPDRLHDALAAQGGKE